MEIQTIPDLLAEHPVLGRFDTEALELLGGCARNRHFATGEIIHREGDPADEILILRKGDVAVEIARAHLPPVIVETLHGGDILGWGWLVPPYRFLFDARALTEVSAVSLDAACLRGKCDANPVLGYQVFKHWLPHMVTRFRAQRLQVADLYGPDHG